MHRQGPPGPSWEKGLLHHRTWRTALRFEETGRDTVADDGVEVRFEAGRVNGVLHGRPMSGERSEVLAARPEKRHLPPHGRSHGIENVIGLGAEAQENDSPLDIRETQIP